MLDNQLLLIQANEKFMSDFKKYKRSHNFLLQIKKEFEKNKHPFRNMDDVEDIIFMLLGFTDPLDNFIDGGADSDDSTDREKKKDIFNDKFFKPF